MRLALLLKWLLITFLVLVIGIIVLFLRGNEDIWVKDSWDNWVMHGNPEVRDFESCASKYPVQESFPRKCAIPKGPTFIEDSQRLAVYGDTRDGHGVHKSIVSLMQKYDPEYIFHTGDLVGDGSKKDQWEVFNSITQIVHNKLYPVLGNHEKNDQNYYNNFTLPGNEQWYFVDTDNIYFICIDSTKILDADPTQLNWFKEQLTIAQSGGKFVAVVMHHPLFSSAKHATDPDTIKLREILVPMIEGKTDVVFAGHDHVYERLEKDGVVYMTVGSAGAPLYEIAQKSSYSKLFASKYNYAAILSTKNQITINIHGESDDIIDSTLLTN